MDSDTRTDPEEQLEQTGDELEQRLEDLDGTVGDAKEGAKAHSDHASGDDELDDDSDDDGQDPGEFDDPDADEEEDEDDE